MIVRKADMTLDTPTPEIRAEVGDFRAWLFSRDGGLSQFGAFVEELAPGARSSDRHWHEAEDEFIYVLDGEATVIENDGPHLLGPGDAACWPAGVPNAHHVVNRSDRPCRYLVVGTRAPADRVHYADVDKIYTRAADGTATRTKRDGSPL
ncbi:cupin domain-containing protein [Rhodobacterales bacterium HKCCE2091]|nr:cupin domain-containing protein [Rhodobacterales bacterium HKCCE2091]